MSTIAWPAPVGAVEITTADQMWDDRDQWVADRRDGLGASEVAAVLGLDPDVTAYEVWLSKMGWLPPAEQTFLMERGTRFEPSCAQWFADVARLSLKRTGTWARVHERWMRASPDRWTSDGAGYEGKIVGEDWGKRWRFGPGQHAFYQCLWGMAVTGLDAWYLAAGMDRGFRWWQFTRDQYGDLIDEVVDVCSLWWYQHIVCDTPPPVDGTVKTSEALKRAFAEPALTWRNGTEPPTLSDLTIEVPGITALRDRRRATLDKIAALEKEKLALDNTIRAALGPHRVATENGLPVLALVQRTRTDVNREAIADREDPTLYHQNPYTQIQEY